MCSLRSRNSCLKLRRRQHGPFFFVRSLRRTSSNKIAEHHHHPKVAASFILCTSKDLACDDDDWPQPRKRYGKLLERSFNCSCTVCTSGSCVFARHAINVILTSYYGQYTGLKTYPHGWAVRAGIRRYCPSTRSTLHTYVQGMPRIRKLQLLKRHHCPARLLNRLY